MKTGRSLLWKVLLALVGLLALLLAGDRFPAFDFLGDHLRELLYRSYFQVGGVNITAVFVFKALIFVVLLVVAARSVRWLLRNRILKHTGLTPGVQYAVEVFIGYVILALGFAIAIQSLGVNLSSLVLLGGAVGVGVGVGLQPVVNNFVSGIILLLERPVRVGDRVEIENLYGDVVRIAGRSTWVRTNDNVVIIVPNLEFITQRITNWTLNDQRVRLRLPIGVAYSAQPEVVRDTLLEVAGRNPGVLKDPKPDVIFKAFGDSSLDFELRVWTSTQVRTPMVLSSELYFAIFQAFSERSIEIPFPQRDVHIRSVVPIPGMPASAPARE
jgi:small-conductance mechanosensitive channel